MGLSSASARPRSSIQRFLCSSCRQDAGAREQPDGLTWGAQGYYGPTSLFSLFLNTSIESKDGHYMYWPHFTFLETRI